MTKQQKTHEMRARVHYVSTQFPLEVGAQALIQTISQSGFVSNAIQGMNLQQLQELDGVAQSAARPDRLVKAVRSMFLPQIRQLEAQKDMINNTITALEEAFDLGFAEEYFEGTAYVTDSFYQSISDRIEALTIEEEVQRRIAAQVPPAAAPDAMIEG